MTDVVYARKQVTILIKFKGNSKEKVNKTLAHEIH